MGRIPKSEKTQLLLKNKEQLEDYQKLNEQPLALINQSLILNRNMNKEINSLIVFNKNSPTNRLNSESNLYFSKEFKCWLNSQLEHGKRLLLLR